MNGRRALDERIESRRRAETVSALRRLATARNGGPAGRPGTDGEEACDLCGNTIPADHRHLLQLDERQILCACEACWALRSGDPELRPVGTRVEWLGDMRMSDEAWARLDVPIGLAFLMISGESGSVVALYPSPAGATESEIDPLAWRALREANPQLIGLEADAEALIVNRLADPPQYAIAPIDECYRLVGAIKLAWEGISGGDGPQAAATSFLDELRERAAA